MTRRNPNGKKIPEDLQKATRIQKRKSREKESIGTFETWSRSGGRQWMPTIRKPH